MGFRCEQTVCRKFNIVAKKNCFCYTSNIRYQSSSYTPVVKLHSYLPTYLPTYLTKKLTEQRPSREAKRSRASHGFRSLLWNPKVHGRVHNSPPFVPILSQTHPLRTLPSYFLKVHFNVRPIHHTRLNLPSGLFPSAFSVVHQNHVRISLIRHACHNPTHLILLDLSILRRHEVPTFASFFMRLLLHLSMLTLLPEHVTLEYL